MRPRFVINNKFQKGGTYKALLTDAVLGDICQRLTGRADFTATFEPAVNIGRLAMLHHRGRSFYVSIAETNVRSRNASFQSLPSALARFELDPAKAKRICYYIHPQTIGDFETPYFHFMYRLMATAGIELINVAEHVDAPVVPFGAPEDLIAAKQALRARGAGNRSTYVTRGPDGETEVYGKTYGASKYETVLIALALARISPDGLRLYEVEEGGLKALPVIGRQAILASGRVTIETSTDAVEALAFRERNSLRSIRFTYNLLDKFKRKACAFCDCAIPQIVQGAHVWPVAAIKQSGLPFGEQLDHALDGHNGLWLCENHHKLFDSATIFVAATGRLKHRRTLAAADAAFLRQVTTATALPAATLHPTFLGYLARRNAMLDEAGYRAI